MKAILHLGSCLLFNRLRNIIISVISLFIIMSADIIVAQETGSFTYPKIPDNITSKDAKIEYVILNYWDNFNYDSLSTSQAEQVFIDFISILDKIDSKFYNDAFFAMCLNMMESAEVMDFMIDCSQKYLYEKGSPNRNHQMLSALIQTVFNSTELDSNQKETAQKMLTNCNRNSFNSVAPDFKFETVTGKIDNLYNNTSDYTLIFFFDPLCQSCLVMGEEIYKSEIINEFAKNMNVSLLYITPYIDDMEKLNTYFIDLPEGWILGFNPEEKIIREKLYFWEYIPSLYLIDSNKKIILKDI